MKPFKIVSLDWASAVDTVCQSNDSHPQIGLKVFLNHFVHLARSNNGYRQTWESSCTRITQNCIY